MRLCHFGALETIRNGLQGTILITSKILSRCNFSGSSWRTQTNWLLAFTTIRRYHTWAYVSNTNTVECTLPPSLSELIFKVGRSVRRSGRHPMLWLEKSPPWLLSMSFIRFFFQNCLSAIPVWKQVLPQKHFCWNKSTSVVLILWKLKIVWQGRCRSRYI